MRRYLVAIFETLSGLALLAVMGLTVADVVLRAIRPQWRIYGIVEMVQLGFDFVIFLAVPAVFLLASNLTVTLVDEIISRRSVLILKRISYLVTAGFIAVALWQALIPGMDSLRYGDETQDLGLPIFIYWLPIFIGLAGAFAGAVWSVFRPEPRSDGADSEISGIAGS